MIVVADTSPLNYLVQIDCQSLLRTLYRRVLVPTAVFFELKDPNSPASIKQWLAHFPEWLVVKPTVAVPDPALSHLGPGEREAIQLAQQEQADLLLIDERKGRTEARLRGLATTGTLGVLLASAEYGLIDAEACYERLIRETNFRTTPMLEKSFLQQVRNRSTGPTTDN